MSAVVKIAQALGIKASEEQLKQLFELVGANFEPNAKSQNKTFIDALINGRSDHVKILMDISVGPDTLDYDGTPALLRALQYGRTTEAKMLIDAGANILATETRFNENALMYISTVSARSNSQDKLEMMQFLLDRGIDVNALSGLNETALMMAAKVNDPAAVQLLVDNGASLDHFNKDSYTALMLAVKNKNAAVAKVLLDADTFTSDEHMTQCIYYAVDSNSLETVLLLMDYGADPHAKFASISALEWAEKSKRQAIADGIHAYLDNKRLQQVAGETIGEAAASPGNGRRRDRM